MKAVAGSPFACTDREHHTVFSFETSIHTPRQSSLNISQPSQFHVPFEPNNVMMHTLERNYLLCFWIL